MRLYITFIPTGTPDRAYRAASSGHKFVMLTGSGSTPREALGDWLTHNATTLGRHAVALNDLTLDYDNVSAAFECYRRAVEAA